MTIIGITGNSGAGKDTVCGLIKTELDAVIVDADYIVRKNQKEGKEYYNKIVDIFGKRVLKSDKTIDRSYLSTRIFADDITRKELNTATFECVKKELDLILEENEDREYAMLNFPLLYEGEFDKMCEFVIAVVADEETKIKRIVIRDKISRDDASKRILSQKSDNFYRTHADFIIDNSNNISYGDLRKQVSETIKKLKENE